VDCYFSLSALSWDVANARFQFHFATSEHFNDKQGGIDRFHRMKPAVFPGGSFKLSKPPSLE
jgi:hypothetical protein